jgi:phage replication O-like protein O
MDGPQLENGFLLVANQIFEDLAKLDITSAQFRVLMVIIRSTYGECERDDQGRIVRDEVGRPVKKRSASICRAKICELTRLGNGSVARALQVLRDRNIINIKPGVGRKSSEYSYQKYRDIWQLDITVADPSGDQQSLKGLVDPTGDQQTGVADPTQDQQRQLADPTGDQLESTKLADPTGDQQTGVADPQLDDLINKDLKDIKEVQPKKEPPQIRDLMQRYRESDLAVCKEYWDTVRRTRQTGKIAESVIRRWMDRWAQHPVELVIQAMTIHCGKYRDKQENYTDGIIRGLVKEQKRGKGVGGTGKAAGAIIRPDRADEAIGALDLSAYSYRGDKE